MPIVNCPDCGGKVSDSAPSCPHCGMPDPANSIGTNVSAGARANDSSNFAERTKAAASNNSNQAVGTFPPVGIPVVKQSISNDMKSNLIVLAILLGIAWVAGVVAIISQQPSRAERAAEELRERSNRDFRENFGNGPSNAATRALRELE